MGSTPYCMLQYAEQVQMLYVPQSKRSNSSSQNNWSNGASNEQLRTHWNLEDIVTWYLCFAFHCACDVQICTRLPSITQNCAKSLTWLYLHRVSSHLHPDRHRVMAPGADSGWGERENTIWYLSFEAFSASNLFLLLCTCAQYPSAQPSATHNSARSLNGRCIKKNSMDTPRLTWFKNALLLFHGCFKWARASKTLVTRKDKQSNVIWWPRWRDGASAHYHMHHGEVVKA